MREPCTSVTNPRSPGPTAAGPTKETTTSTCSIRQKSAIRLSQAVRIGQLFEAQNENIFLKSRPKRVDFLGFILIS